jgi:hypothetical protein
MACRVAHWEAGLCQLEIDMVKGCCIYPRVAVLDSAWWWLICMAWHDDGGNVRLWLRTPALYYTFSVFFFHDSDYHRQQLFPDLLRVSGCMVTDGCIVVIHVV